MDHNDSLRAHADRLRASGVLGRSRLMESLFTYLVDCSLQGKAPKEIEVAVDVFGKDAQFDVSHDAMVRVYIHKLRRKLEEFYAGLGAAESERLVIPKGAYRFVLESSAEAAPATISEPEVPALSEPESVARPALSWKLAAIAATALIVIGGLLGALSQSTLNHAPDGLQAVREHSVWTDVLSDDRPIFVVVGDYYIFGETDDDSMSVNRLVRDFSINSQRDLQRHIEQHPELEERYLDVEVAYLPTASALALRDIMPVLSSTGRRVRIAMMSEVNPAILKSAHVVYIGYLSGLGRLQGLIFAGSRFSVGETYDELIDRKTNRHYVSQLGSHIRGESKYHDYGYFSTFKGPGGNRIVIIAGTRDVALMQTAEALTSDYKLKELSQQTGKMDAYEALYEVYGMDRLNLDGKLLLASELDTARIWKDEPYQAKAAE